MLCVGQTFEESRSIGDFLKKNGELVVLPTFLIDFSDMGECLCELYPEGYQLAPNLHFLGRAGILDIQGIRIAFLNGLRFPGTLPPHTAFTGHYYSAQDIQKVLSQLSSLREEGELREDRGVDVFINCEWPSQVVDRAEKESLGLANRPEVFSAELNDLLDALSPRYHFVGGSGLFY